MVGVGQWKQGLEFLVLSVSLLLKAISFFNFFYKLLYFYKKETSQQFGIILSSLVTEMHCISEIVMTGQKRINIFVAQNKEHRFMKHV